MQPKKRLLFGLFALAFCLSAPSALARDWQVGDSDLPSQLSGMTQSQLNIINKVDELNPSHENFNQALFDMFKQSQQTPTVNRSGSSTTVLPDPDPKTSAEIGGTPQGTGLAPAASDGPVTYVGSPLGSPNPTTRDRDPEDGPPPGSLGVGGEGSFGYVRGPLGTVRPRTFLEALISGSGGQFGDCVGADCIPHIGFPGDPLGGAPVGSWVHHDIGRTNFSFAQDGTLLAFINEGPNGISQAQSTLENQLGQDVAFDPRARGF